MYQSSPIIVLVPVGDTEGDPLIFERALILPAADSATLELTESEESKDFPARDSAVAPFKKCPTKPPT